MLARELLDSGRGDVLMRGMARAVLEARAAEQTESMQALRLEFARLRGGVS